MPQDPNIHVMPRMDGSMDSLHSDIETRLLQRRKWMVLGSTFLAVTLVGLLLVWLRAPIYQSQAILHFTYPQPTASALDSVSNEQINIHAQRLTSNSILTMVQAQLGQQQGIDLPLETLSKMLQSEAQPESRLIRLAARDSSVDNLLPALSSWIEIYLTLQESEKQDNSAEEIASLDDKILALNDLIIETRGEITAFGEEHQIISLERDENRALNNIKGLSGSLDNAVEERAQATAKLAVIEQAIKKGEALIRPQDQSAIDNLGTQAQLLSKQLADIREKYTEEYMAFDPQIVAMKRDLETIRQSITARVSESQQAYRTETKQELDTIKQRTTDLNSQFSTLERQAQQFNSKLVEYRALDQDLKDLELQSQQLKQQRVQLEVQRPYEARIDLLEQPFEPRFPIGPNYWLDSAIVIGIAAILSLLSLGIFSSISKQRRSSLIVAPIAVNTSPQAHVQLGGGSGAMLPQSNPYKLAHASATQISDKDLSNLCKNCNREGYRATGLLLSGVAPSELFELVTSDVDIANRKLHMGGRYRRDLIIGDALCEDLEKHINSLPSGVSMWSTPDGDTLALEDINELLQQAAVDAQLEDASGMSVDGLRHSYLVYLSNQGCKLNELELIAGYVGPTQLSQIRQSSTAPSCTTADQLDTDYFSHL